MTHPSEGLLQTQVAAFSESPRRSDSGTKIGPDIMDAWATRPTPNKETAKRDTLWVELVNLSRSQKPFVLLFQPFKLCSWLSSVCPSQHWHKCVQACTVLTSQEGHPWVESFAGSLRCGKASASRSVCRVSVQGQFPSQCAGSVSGSVGLEGSTRRSLGDRPGPRLGRGGRAACAKLRNLGFILRAAGS